MNTTSPPTTSSIHTYTVLASSVGTINLAIRAYNRKIARINKRHKTELRPVAFRVVREFKKAFTNRGGTLSRHVLMAELEITGDRATLSDWEIEAVIQQTDKGYALVQVKRDHTDVPALMALVERGGDCDHCKTSRGRAATYIVTNGDKRYVVGTSCLGDFTGNMSPKGVVAYADSLSGFWRELDGIAESDDEVIRTGGAGMRVTTAVQLVEYLAWVNYMINLHGWRSRKEAYERGGPATANLAWEQCLRKAEVERQRQALEDSGAPERDPVSGDLAPELVAARELAASSPDAADRARAERDIDLVLENLEGKNESDMSSYDATLLIILRQGFVVQANAGYAASIAVAAKKIRDRAEALPVFAAANSPRAKLGAPKNEWYGNLKDRCNFVLVCKGSEEKDTTFGRTNLTTFDLDGHVIKAFLTGTPLVAGHTYEVRGTIVKHEEWKGRRSTVINRCVIKGK